MNKVVSTLIEELTEANDNGELCEYLERHKYCQVFSDSYAECFVKNGQKILVVGDTRIGRNIMEEITYDNCVEFKDIVIIDDYAKMTNNNFDLILKSGKYSDIIVGPNPHMVKALKGNNSLIAKLIRGRIPWFIQLLPRI